MEKTIRLHRQHDMDLISLYRVEGFSFAKEMKQALHACAAGKEYKIHVPKEDYRPGYIKKSLHLHIFLDPKKDADILKLLSTVRKGQGNAFMKAVFRNSLDYIPYRAYGTGSGFAMSIEEADGEPDLIPEPERERYEPGQRPQGKQASAPGNTQDKKGRASEHARVFEEEPRGSGDGKENMAAHSANNPGGQKPASIGSKDEQGLKRQATELKVDDTLPFDSTGNVVVDPGDEDPATKATDPTETASSEDMAFMDDLFEQMDRLTH